MNKYTIEELEEVSIEYLQCSYCGAKLRRVLELIPTSCMYCNKHNLIPNNKKIVFVDDLK